VPLADLGARLAAPALANTFLTRLPGDARDALLATGSILEIPHRQVIFGSSDRPRVGFLLEGLARVYLSARTGRQLTVRYGRAGDILGNISGAPGARTPLSAATVTDCALIEIEMETLLHLVDTDARVGAALVAELTLRLQDSYAALGANTLGSMPERVAWHLLDAAIMAPANGRLTAGLSQQQLADSVGTSREVVARVLSRLRAEGIVSTTQQQIEVVDPVRLAAIAGRKLVWG
jgi:CRP/FNR family transcriptional regulator, cyclic AMP receptor protein